MDLKLNLGGVLGALAGGGICGTLLVMMTDGDTSSRFLARLSILAVVVGAVAGNFLWNRLFTKSSWDE